MFQDYYKVSNHFNISFWNFNTALEELCNNKNEMFQKGRTNVTKIFQCSADLLEMLHDFSNEEVMWLKC